MPLERVLLCSGPLGTPPLEHGGQVPCSSPADIELVRRGDRFHRPMCLEHALELLERIEAEGLTDILGYYEIDP